MKIKPIVHIFDVNSHIARLYKGMFSPEKFTPNERHYHNGEPVYMLKPLLKMVVDEMNVVAKRGYANSHTVIVFDHPDKNYRHRIYPNYKSNRPAKPEEWTRQIELAVDMFRALGFAVLQEPDVESDDVIATLSETLSKHEIVHVIFSGDKDLKSLVGKCSLQYAGKEKVLYDESSVLEKMGVSGDKIIDYLAMRGDTADGLPGIENVGDKTARAILELGTLEDALDDPEKLLALKVKGISRVVEWLKVEENKDKARLMKSLTTLKKDVPLAVSNLKLMTRKAPNYDAFLDGYMRPSAH